MNIPILMYHSIDNHASAGFQAWCTPPERFEQHLAYLREEGYTGMTVAELQTRVQRGRVLPKKPVVLTFDDAFVDFATNAFPLLDQYNFPATLYVPTGYVGDTSRWLEELGEGDRPILGWEQLRVLHQAGIECGGHSHRHLELDLVPPVKVFAEINDCKTILQERLECPVSSFAYPHGYYNRRVREMVVRAGYMAACAVKHAMSFPDDDPFALARIDIRNHITVDRLHQYLNGGVPLASRKVLIRTRLWRTARRANLHRSQWVQKVVSALSPQS